MSINGPSLVCQAVTVHPWHVEVCYEQIETLPLSQRGYRVRPCGSLRDAVTYRIEECTMVVRTFASSSTSRMRREARILKERGTPSQTS